MTAIVSGTESLKRLFAGLTEQTFQVELGVADPPLVDYLSDLLVRFTRTDALFGIRNVQGQRLQQVTDLLEEAQARTDKPQRDLFRHIGDITLFRLGLFPESLKTREACTSKDALIDYREEGKRSYHVASQLTEPTDPDEARLYQLLSESFEVCSEGLSLIRREWQRTVKSV